MPVLDHAATKPVCNLTSIVLTGLAIKQSSQNSKKLKSLPATTENANSAQRCHAVIKTCNYGFYSYCSWGLVSSFRFCAPPTNITGAIAATIAYKLTKYDKHNIEKIDASKKD